MKDLIKQPLSFMLIVACLVVIVYFSIKIYKEIKPGTAQEKKMECLKLGSDARATACLRLLK